jgi:hypothetical protein
VDSWLDHHGTSDMRAFWEKLRDLPSSYLAHEFGGMGSAQWPQDVADKLAPAGMTFLGQAQLAANYQPLVMGEDGRALVQMGEAHGFARTAADIAGSLSFRADLFHRGAPSLAPAEIAQTLDGRFLVPPVAAQAEDPDFNTPGPSAVAMLEKITHKLPQPIGRALKGVDENPAAALRAMFLALALHRVDLGWPKDDSRQAAAGAFNVTALARARAGAPLPCLVCARRRLPIRVTRAEAAEFARTGQMPVRLSDCDFALKA